jgi:hypothetical protein
MSMVAIAHAVLPQRFASEESLMFIYDISVGAAIGNMFDMFGDTLNGQYN